MVNYTDHSFLHQSFCLPVFGWCGQWHILCHQTFLGQSEFHSFSLRFYYKLYCRNWQTTSGLLTIETLITSVVVSCINIFLPPLFALLAEFERYKTTTGKITVILIRFVLCIYYIHTTVLHKRSFYRSVIVRLMPIIVVVASWLGNITCTQPTESDGCTSDEFRVSARSRST